MQMLQISHLSVAEQLQSLVTTYCSDQDQAPSELVFRKIVVILHSNRHEEISFLKALAKQNRLNTTIVLKVLALTHRVFLYCPFLEVKHLLSLYRNVSANWREIEQQQIKEPTDRARCIFFSKLIQAYADVLYEKANLVGQFNLIIDSCYCLQAGMSH